MQVFQTACSHRGRRRCLLEESLQPSVGQHPEVNGLARPTKTETASTRSVLESSYDIALTSNYEVLWNVLFGMLGSSAIFSLGMCYVLDEVCL